MTTRVCVQVQALQTELQFKEAEINDMKSRLHTSDRKKTAPLLPRHRSVTMVTIRNTPALLTWTLSFKPGREQGRCRLAFTVLLSKLLNSHILIRPL